MIRAAVTPLLLLLLALPAGAQPGAGAEALAGTFRYVGGAAEEARREAAIDAATEDLARLLRLVARQRIRQRTVPEPRIAIELGEGSITLRRGDDAITVGTDGEPHVVEREDGEATFRAALVAGRLELRTETALGSRHARYSVDADGETLTVMVRIEAGPLPAPVVYRLTYRRE